MNTLTNPIKIFLTITIILGAFLYIYYFQFALLSLTNIFLIIFLTIGLSLINFYTIYLPPKGNSLSMDSAIFLATIYLFGLEFSLNILLFSTILFMFIYSKISWWKHLLNFSVYTFMLIGFHFSYIYLGGTISSSHINENMFPFICAVLVYSLINISILSIYLTLISKNSYLNIVSTMLKEGALLFIVNILLSIILIIVSQSQLVLGYTLLISVLLLLSFAFRQHFQLYLKTNEKASKDFLTGLNNHSSFKETLEEIIKDAHDSNQQLCLALLDIDDFKKYNDFYGHMQGDTLLKFFGTLLETECNKHEYFVARYGGEEFTILMQNTPLKQATIFMERLRKKVNDTYLDGVESLPYHCLSFSAGISEYKKDLYDSQELLNRADQAMYSAKEQGKNMIRVADNEFSYSTQKTISFEKELKEAEQQLNIFLSKDVYTYRHSKRVYKYAVDFSGELELTDAERKTFILGSLVHDIGKLEIPRDIINKKGKLDPHEWEIMKKHVTWGKEIISTNKSLSDLIPLVELHHERFDGDGYPHGLKEYEIPKLARILCIIDSFDAMTTERPYQATRTFTEAIQELRTCAGKQFDPQYVEPFIGMIQKIYALQLEMEQTATEA